MTYRRRRSRIAWLVAALIAAGGGYLLFNPAAIGPTPIPATAPPATPSSSSASTSSPTATATSSSSGAVTLGLPNPSLTPGATNPDVTQATIGQTICVSGWTATIRPPVSYTAPLKIKSIADYGYSDTSPSSYEFDHLVPLEVGGNPTDTRNLWAEPHHILAPDGTDYGSGLKDRLENHTKALVCAGQMSLADAEHGFETDWVALWVSEGKP